MHLVLALKAQIPIVYFDDILCPANHSTQSIPTYMLFDLFDLSILQSFPNNFASYLDPTVSHLMTLSAVLKSFVSLAFCHCNSPNPIESGFLHLAYCIWHSFKLLCISVVHYILLSSVPWYGYTTVYLAIQQLKDIGLFSVLVIMNRSAINICIQVFVWI